MLHTTAEYRSRERGIEGDRESGLSACVCSKPTQQTTLRQIVGIKRSSPPSSDRRTVHQSARFLFSSTSIPRVPPYLRQSVSLALPSTPPLLGDKKGPPPTFTFSGRFRPARPRRPRRSHRRVVSTFTFTLLLLFLASRHHH